MVAGENITDVLRRWSGFMAKLDLFTKYWSEELQEMAD